MDFGDQLEQIKVGGLPTLHRKMRALIRCLPILFLFIFNSIWAIPAVLFIRIIKPWADIRMGTFLSSRMGHFIVDPSLFLARHSLRSEGHRTIDVFYIPEPTCNEQWAKMVRRQLFVRPWVRYLVFFNRLVPGGKAHDLLMYSGTTFEFDVIRQSSVRLKFLREEESIAKTWLKRRGWKEGEKFVCLNVRDSAYLNKDKLFSNQRSNSWDYHNYRDSNIDTYVEAVQALVERGYWVVRMGKIVDKRLAVKNHKVIDYPFAEDRNDLLDIWLTINCHFLISTATGLDCIPWIYGKPPVVYVNALPLLICATQINHLWVPKHLTWKASGEPLTLREHCQHDYGLGEDYDEAGIGIQELSADEITSAVLECEQRVSGDWVDTSDDRDRMIRYWEVFQSTPKFHKFHNYVHPEARVGSAWLKFMGDAFLE